MSSLPMISHRLFVAAVRPVKPERARPTSYPEAKPVHEEAPLRAVEVVLDGEPGSRRVPQPARAQVCVI